MGDDDGAPPVVLQPGWRYRIIRLCDPMGPEGQVVLGMTGRMVAFSLEGKYVGQARVVAADPFEGWPAGGVMLTCELVSLEANQLMAEWEPGRWWRVAGPDGEVWCEASTEEEAREAMRPGDELFRQWRRVEEEWRPVSQPNAR